MTTYNIFFVCCVLVMCVFGVSPLKGNVRSWEKKISYKTNDKVISDFFGRTWSHVIKCSQEPIGDER